MSHLLVAKKQNELLQHDAEAGPIGTSVRKTHVVQVPSVKSKNQKFKKFRNIHSD